jgi:hypothetical protein
MAFSCVSQRGEFKNTTEGFWGKTMSTTFPPKQLKTPPVFLPFPPFDFVIAFLAVSLNEEFNTAIQTGKPPKTENLNTSQVGRCVAFLFFLLQRHLPKGLKSGRL